jgi:hypothetical protein
LAGKPTAKLIRDRGRQPARLEGSGRRAGELAAEVERLNRAVLNAAARLDFNDEPARFADALRACRHVEKKR